MRLNVYTIERERHQPDMKIPIIIYSSINIIKLCVLYKMIMCDMTWMVFGLFYSCTTPPYYIAGCISENATRGVGRNKSQGGVQWTFIIIISCGRRTKFLVYCYYLIENFLVNLFDGRIAYCRCTHRSKMKNECYEENMKNNRNRKFFES